MIKNYKNRILDRAKIVGIEISDEKLGLLNEEVNHKIKNGSHEFDALDMIYFKLKREHNG